MTTTAIIFAVLACVAIAAIGIRFLVRPTAATRDFGIRPDDVRALTAIKGVRDITSGIVPLVVLAVAGPHAFGWALLAAALTPVGDAVSVTTNGGTLRHALSVHAATALVLVVVGLVLALG